MSLKGFTVFKLNLAKTSGAHISLADTCALTIDGIAVSLDSASLAGGQLNVIHSESDATITMSNGFELYIAEDTALTGECSNPPREGSVLTDYTASSCTWACSTTHGYVAQGDECFKTGTDGLHLVYSGCFEYDANTLKPAPLQPRLNPYKCGSNALVLGDGGVTDGVCVSFSHFPDVFECSVAYGGKMSLAMQRMTSRQKELPNTACPTSLPSREGMACYMFSCRLGYGWVDGVGCEECEAGTYSDTEDMQGCKQCEPGTYNELSGMTSCIACPSGKWSDALGVANVTMCSSCPEGLHNPTEGGNSIQACVPCKAGYYSPNEATSK